VQSKDSFDGQGLPDESEQNERGDQPGLTFPWEEFGYPIDAEGKSKRFRNCHNLPKKIL